jgi:hypothetical protein
MGIAIVITGAIIILLVLSLLIVSMWKVYTKAGKAGWASIIPIYNTIVLLQIVGKPWWWIFLFCIPGVNFVFLIWMNNLLSLSFGKSASFTVGLVLIPIVFIPILGLGKATYNGPAGK